MRSRSASPEPLGGPSTGCHERTLPLDSNFEALNVPCSGKHGPAGSDDECSRANDGLCTIIRYPNTTSPTHASDKCQDDQSR